MVWAVPLSTMDLITHRLTPKDQERGIRSLTEVGNPCGPRVQSVLYLRVFALRLALKLFRGEPAISGFDWHFTPTHPSSPHFSTYVGSGLQQALPCLHPGDG